MALLEEAEIILAALGIPLDRLSPKKRAHAARTFVALAGLKPGDTWAQAQDMSTLTLTTKQILRFGRIHHGETRSDGSYDDVRRKDLLLPIAAQVIQSAANNLHANTNDGTRGYGIHPKAAQLARTFGTGLWAQSCNAFEVEWPSLAKALERARALRRIPIRIADDHVLLFEPNVHNQIQKAVIEVFLELFGHGAELLYVGDATDRGMFRNEERLRELGVFDLEHDKLPDVAAYSESRNWLFLIEAVDSANPVTEIRRLTFERLLDGKCKADRVYVSAFPDRATFRKFAAEIAWETEVWVADVPEHMVHFNGDKFLGPHATSSK
jgi:hypothetical protein